MVKMEEVIKNYDRFSLNCSLEVKPGRITGLVGVNGAGKSTAFKSILGLISIDGGNIQLFGKDINDVTTRDKEKIGVVLSEGSFCEYFTIKKISGIMKAMYPDYSEQYVSDMCSKFELPYDKKIKEFSTGMKARLNIILATSYGAKLLILDEPTVGLDVIARNELLDILRDYMAGNERSILISSHISSDLESICDDMYMIHNGSIIFHEDTDVIIGEYGVIKVDEEQYRSIDRKHVVCEVACGNGYDCLVSDRRFYIDNYPGIVVEKGNIDNFIGIASRGNIKKIPV